MSRLRLSSPAVAAMWAHALTSLPEECCGVLLGEDRGERRVEAALPAANVREGDRRTGYFMAPADLLAAGKRARREALQIVGYYHSHPAGGGMPSERDRRHAWPGASYLILGLAGAGEIRSWRLNGAAGFEEETIEIGEER